MTTNLAMTIHSDPPNYLNVDSVKKSSRSPARGSSHTGALCLAGVCVGLMCIIQGTLNVVLRLYPVFPVAVNTSCNNHTLSIVTGELQKNYSELLKSNNQLRRDYVKLGEIRDKLQQENGKLQKKLTNITEDLKTQGWIAFRSSLYYMSTQEKNWRESSQDCKQRGADLVIIKSQDEQDFIEMLRRGSRAWIGLTDLEEEGKFKWVDGTKLTTGYWLSQEPNNLNGNEHCVETGYIPPDERPQTDIRNTWNDDVCSGKAFWICEKKFSL